MPRIRVAVALLVVLVVALVAVRPANAQVVLGTVRDSATRSPIADATISLMDSAGLVLDQTRSSATGTFVVNARRPGRVQFLIRQIGSSPSVSAPFDVPSSKDTLRIELSAPVLAVSLTELRVLEEADRRANYNWRQLTDARSGGWRVVEPYELAEARDAVTSFGEMMRRHPLPGVRPPRGGSGCYRYARTNKCLTLIVDGQVVGPDAHIAPNEVYFFAFLSAAQAAVHFGSRARDGAIFIATRRAGDIEIKP